jgi:hypothetical protein
VIYSKNSIRNKKKFISIKLNNKRILFFYKNLKIYLNRKRVYLSYFFFLKKKKKNINKITFKTQLNLILIKKKKKVKKEKYYLYFSINFCYEK